MVGALWGCCAVSADEASSLIHPSIVVLEFHDFSSYRGHMLGRRVALELHRALASSGRWSLVDPERASAAVAEMELDPPFAVGYQQALAHRLRADLAVTGRIEGAQTGSGGGRVSVTLILDFVERIAGQSMMPMAVTGVSAATDAPTPADVRVDAAIADACARVATAAAGANRAQAAVVGVRGNELTLDTGHGVSMLVDDTLLVYRVHSSTDRASEPVGVALVKSVDGREASAVLLGKDRDVYTDDRAVCVGPARRAAGPPGAPTAQTRQ